MYSDLKTSFFDLFNYKESLFNVEMSKEIIVSIKGSKSFVHKVPEADNSYLSRLGTTLKSVQQDVNEFLTKAIEEEKGRGGVADQQEIENIDIVDDDADSSEEEEDTNDLEQKNKRMKSC